MMRIWLAVMVVMLAVASASAAEVTGRLEQGGLALGRAAPGAVVRLDGRAVPVDADGRFLLGFGRDAAAQAVLEIDGVVQTLTVAKRSWQVQRIDGLPPARVSPDPAQLARIKAEAELLAARRAAVSSVALFLGGVAAPADGRVSGVFGSQRVLNGEPRAPHSGVDIAAPTGAPARAVAEGVVTLAHPDLFLTGATVMVDHGLGLQTVYAHLSRLDVAEGQRIVKGQLIGAVGATGMATGPHLHWGASWLEVKLDPDTVLAVLGGG